MITVRQVAQVAIDTLDTGDVIAECREYAATIVADDSPHSHDGRCEEWVHLLLDYEDRARAALEADGLYSPDRRYGNALTVDSKTGKIRWEVSVLAAGRVLPLEDPAGPGTVYRCAQTIGQELRAVSALAHICLDATMLYPLRPEMSAGAMAAIGVLAHILDGLDG